MNILICGVGAIGSNLVNHLVPDLKGEHQITILDMDQVEERNITPGTQVYFPDQIGLPKVEALQLNIYKRYEREIQIINKNVNDCIPVNQDLIVDCFDNYEARKHLQDIWAGSLGHGTELLHIGFSDRFTFAIEWGHNYQVPTDITSGLDICEMPGASAFVGSVSSMGAMVVEEFIRNNKKMEILGGKMYTKVLD